MPKVLKITSVHCLCSISKRIDILHADKHESLLQADSIIFDGFGQACPNYQGKFAISLCHLKKEIGMKLLLQFVMNPMFSHHCPFLNPSAAWP